MNKTPVEALANDILTDLLPERGSTLILANPNGSTWHIALDHLAQRGLVTRGRSGSYTRIA